jgi:poly-beta-1,6-N-acetyl-D-glucosamine synthase
MAETRRSCDAAVIAEASMSNSTRNGIAVLVPTHQHVTALIPAHNEEASLASTLASLEAQTRPVDRIIVAADNCTDATSEVAAGAGAEVFETVDNSGRKAGALNQALRTIDDTGIVLVLDADTAIVPTFVAQGMSLLEKDSALGAVGGVFRGENPRGYLETCQSNEYTRYGVQIDTTERTSVLTGTAALIRAEALTRVANARGGLLPGVPGEVYNESAITEDSELTLALKHLGYRLSSPAGMACTTELMPTWGDLHKQRVRWYKGMLDNLVDYGVTRITARYIGQQIMLTVGTLMLTTLVLLTAFTVITGTFAISVPWLAVGGIFLAERLVTVWRSSTKSRFLALAIFLELLYDFALQGAFVRAVWLTATKRQTTWNHVNQSSREVK